MAAATPNRPRVDNPPPFYRPPGWGRTARARRRGGLHRGLASLRAQLSLRPWRIDILLIVGYLVVTRIGSLSAAKWGIEIGSVPLYLTDITMLSLLLVTIVKRSGQLLFWGTAGQEAGVAGRATWMLCVAAVVYFVFAYPVYRMFAVRDLAIFIYSMFFPLTYFAVDSRVWAQRITRYCIYSGLVLGMLVVFQLTTGVDINFVGTINRTVMGRDITYVGNDDFGGILAASTIGLIAYALLERERRTAHLMAAALCFVAMAATGTRSAVVALAAAAFVTFMLLSHRYRLGSAIVAIAFAGALLAGAALPETIPGVQALHNFYLGIVSATGGSMDPNAAYRIERWKDAYHTWTMHPIFGVGFGRDILHQTYVGAWSEGKINLGMPHNTYLYLLARAGLLGFGLIATAMTWGFWKLGMAVRRYRQADDLAALTALVSMAAFAAFVLFFERPMTNATFWIMLAVGVRLAQTSRSAWLASLPRMRSVIAGELRGEVTIATAAP
jgi:O-antigen ligase